MLKIGDIASAVGVSVDTIRHYERKGVLGEIARDASGYRRYSPDVVRRVAVVRRALNIGFTLDELSAFFRQRNAGSPPCRKVRALAARKLTELEEEIAALASIRDSLTRTLAIWDEKLGSTPEGGFAYLFDAL